MQSIFQHGKLSKDVNQMLITLIPKVPQPNSIIQYRPISLCNFANKIIAKIIGNRLKPLMNGLILESRNALCLVGLYRII